MKILMVNKFLHPNGGSETYIFELGNGLLKRGHKIEYFGMEHKGRCVGNSVNAYTSDMDFHNSSPMEKLIYSLKTIYSFEARKKIREVLDDFEPDIVHLNNFNFQLTPSIIIEIRKWSVETKHSVKIIYTAHDYQLVCPNHMMRLVKRGENCEDCAGGKFINCLRGACIHDSKVKSAIGALEGYYWKLRNIYKEIDVIICPSNFIKSKLDLHPLFKEKTLVLHNFISRVEWKDVSKKNYILYFGRFSEEKGVKTLLHVCKELPEIPFIFAGAGPLERCLEGVQNVQNVGFLKKKDLENLIREACFCIYPSEWYENCPFSVMESQSYGTPVLGANIGGIPELIQKNKTGALFESGNIDQLKQKIETIWKDREMLKQYRENCRWLPFDNVEDYCKKLETIYSS